MARKKHSKPEIENALRYAETHGWKVRQGGSHAWGKIYIVHIITMNAVVENFVFPVSGVHLKMQAHMQSKSRGL